MAPSIGYMRASTTFASTSNQSVLRSLSSSKFRRSRAVTVRTLWWWSRHGTWSSSNDENIEERIQKHQKIMRHRYSRALRRRAMWDRDVNSPSWLWHAADGNVIRRWGACRTVSSCDPRKTSSEDKQDETQAHEDIWTKKQRYLHSLDRDFESFKAAIDRAVEKDAYGTLFGNRLQGPTSYNNSSWISWLLNRNDDPQGSNVKHPETTKARKIEIEVLNSEGSPVEKPSPRSTSTAPTGQPTRIQSSSSKEEYTYDPISGRKVLRNKMTTALSAHPKQTLLQTSHAEHGSSPDGITKQQQTRGSQPKLSEVPLKRCVLNAQDATGHQPNPENSRVHEYQRLRAAALGSSIHTAPQFSDRYTPESKSSELRDESSLSKTRPIALPEEDPPLFTGTTYESKVAHLVQDIGETSVPWLQKEGFQDGITPSLNSNQKVNLQVQKLEPSLDRMRASPEAVTERRFMVKLQPAIDRIQTLKSGETAPVAPTISSSDRLVSKIAATTPSLNCRTEPDRREDVDLLRASDVRAATKTARTTMQEAQQAKSERSHQLETEYVKLQKQDVETFVSDVKQLKTDSGKPTRSMDGVSKHAEQHPSSLLAGSAKSISGTSDKFKDYRKPYSPGKADLTEKLEFKSRSLQELPSIYKGADQRVKAERSSDTQQVKKEESERQARTEALRFSSKIASEDRKKDNQQIELLARGIRQIYESEYGPIDLSLAEDSSITKEPVESLSRITDPAGSISDRLEDYETARVRFLSDVQSLAKDITSIKTRATKLQDDMQSQSLTGSEVSTDVEKLTAEAKFYGGRLASLDRKIKQDLAQTAKPHPLSTATVKPGVAQYPDIEYYTTIFEPRYVEILRKAKSVKAVLHEVSSSLHDLKRRVMKPEIQKINHYSPLSQQTQSQTATTGPKTTEQVKSQMSLYLILVYNKTTGEIDRTAVDRLPWTATERTAKAEKADPMKIMSSLNYPAVFVAQFVELEKAGYEVSGGGGDVLIFRSKVATSPPAQSVTKPIDSVSSRLRNAIATEEASSQPEITETVAQPRRQVSREAATVLDDIPADIPVPGPSAPTAPPVPQLGQQPKPPGAGPKVRRQEHVFSGTLPVRPATSVSHHQNQGAGQGQGQADTCSSSGGNNSNSGEFDGSSANGPEPSLFSRTTRALKRGVFGVAAFSVAAYAIGVVSEGIGAQAQVEGDAATGPRRKVVLPTGQRAGIYSTESSRD